MLLLQIRGYGKVSDEKTYVFYLDALRVGKKGNITS